MFHNSKTEYLSKLTYLNADNILLLEVLIDFSQKRQLFSVCVYVVGIYVGMSVHVKMTGNNMFLLSTL